MSMPRVLFLHGIEGSPGVEKHKLIVKCVGKENVKAPNLHTRQTIMIFTIGFVLLVAAFITSTVICFLKVATWVGCVFIIATLTTLCILYFVAGRITTKIMLTRAIWIAEKHFSKFKPNIIAASSFGAVVAFKMDIPKCPLLLFSPAQDMYTKFMHIKDKFSIKDYPYVIIVHGEMDKTVPLNDSQRLLSSISDENRCRLELVASDNHMLKSISQTDMQKWIDEVYTRGKEVVMKWSHEGNRDVDFTLFQENDESKENKKKTNNERSKENLTDAFENVMEKSTLISKEV